MLVVIRLIISMCLIGLIRVVLTLIILVLLTYLVESGYT